ncbi:chorismate lyase [Prochlorococcus sp. AH-716-G04]|uniref:chorismate lyase n=1 Tax=Prochlorococcus sp. TaxID=1220 RepID=UPI002583FE43|nr:chorismate lyase [uncultured Prochlorococcus sp.]MDC3160480.1 chorismate lyase [Prochlorococcus sp. AH-716-G04]MDC3163999.1 chorismate lyase [Prochlorococcus sp. AH-716-F13]MDC3168912.1 chorismate lyase [Prochlorococcus sp. AH-716-E17]
MVTALNNKLFNSPKILWEEKATAFLVANALPKISGAWKLMLLGDGSPTRHLQLLTNHETKIRLISMQIDPLFKKEGPREIDQLKEPLIRRQVWIRNQNKNLAWAESWWNSEQVSQNLKSKEEPIWKNLTQDRSELFREVDSISIVNSNWLEEEFCFEGPFWSRNYRFFRNKKPLTIIREVFNPLLETWLGPSGIQNFSNLYSSSSRPRNTSSII